MQRNVWHRNQLHYITAHEQNLNVLSAAPIEYQNYYEGNPAADRNGSAGIVGVMKRSEEYSVNRLMMTEMMILFCVSLTEYFPPCVGFQIFCKGTVPAAPR